MAIYDAYGISEEEELSQQDAKNEEKSCYDDFNEEEFIEQEMHEQEMIEYFESLNNGDE
jgi:hypothetical protein